MQVNDAYIAICKCSGARVSNTYAICLLSGDNISNEVLIPDDAAAPHGDVVKVYMTSRDELASD